MDLSPNSAICWMVLGELFKIKSVNLSPPICKMGLIIVLDGPSCS